MSLEQVVAIGGSSLFLVLVGFLWCKVYRYLATLPVLYRFDRIRDELWQCSLAHYYGRTEKSHRVMLTHSRKMAIWADTFGKHPEWMTTTYMEKHRFFHLHKYIREYVCLFMTASPPEKFRDHLKECSELDAPLITAIKEGRIDYP